MILCQRKLGQTKFERFFCCGHGFMHFTHLKKNRLEAGLTRTPNGTMKTDNSKASEKFTMLMMMSEVPVSKRVAM